jgi:hypothetical protein
MNRKLRNDGTWYKRNGPKGSDIAWAFDISGGVTDPLLLNSQVLFTYTPAGNVPADAYGDSLLTTQLLFTYTPAGNVPEDAYGDPLTLDADIVDFSYTI